jgi:DNA-binding response OmpR family regulator
VKVEGCGNKPLAIYALPKLRVLCVDDNRDCADSTGILLELYGCEVSVCYDAETAFLTALRFKPDLCLIDLNMPNLSGCDLASRLRAWSGEATTLLIAISAYGSDVARAVSHAAGFDKHMLIPVDWDELLELLIETEQRLGRPPYISSRLATASGDALETTAARKSQSTTLRDAPWNTVELSRRDEKDRQV